jgi:hypothetical protein
MGWCDKEWILTSVLMYMNEVRATNCLYDCMNQIFVDKRES